MEILSLVLSITALLVSSGFAFFSNRRHMQSHDREARDHARRMANEVACWAEPDIGSEPPKATLHIRNGSAQPIRQIPIILRPWYEDFEPQGASEVNGSQFMGVLGPVDEEEWDIELEQSILEVVYASGNLPVEMSFTDAEGQLWTRNVEGILLERQVDLGGFC